MPKRGNGSHEPWRHPMLSQTLTISGKDVDDVPIYLEKQLAKLFGCNQETRDSERGFMSRYSMNVQWSEADQLFLVTIPEFADHVVMPCTHGETHEQAIHNGEEVIEMYLKAWQMEGESIPEPKILQAA